MSGALFIRAVSEHLKMHRWRQSSYDPALMFKGGGRIGGIVFHDSSVAGSDEVLSDFESTMRSRFELDPPSDDGQIFGHAAETDH